jgi:hypothetical protein
MLKKKYCYYVFTHISRFFALFLKLLLLFLESFLLNCSLNGVVSHQELLFNLINRGNWSIVPRVALNFSKRESLSGILGEEGVHEVHEIS